MSNHSSYADLARDEDLGEIQVRVMRKLVDNQSGAALVTVLLFVVLVFILITSMLSVTSREIVIAALQRDGVRALERAQTGIQEAVRRMEEGRTYWPSFTSSAVPGMTVTVIRRGTGSNAAFLEIQATGEYGPARRRLVTLVLGRTGSFPPNVFFAERLNETGSAEISSGDVYSRTYVRYRQYPTDEDPSVPPTITYAGWRISKTSPNLGPCYTHVECRPLDPPRTQRWFPATRRSAFQDSNIARDILNWARNAQANGCSWPSTPTFSGMRADGLSVVEPQYGFDRDNQRWDGALIPTQLAPSKFPCGLPYKYVEEAVVDEAGNPVVPPTRWFKHIIFEQWFENYWRFDQEKLTMIKRNGSACTDGYCLSSGVEPNLVDYPEFGAIPPPPAPIAMEGGNYDRVITGSGTVTLTEATVGDLGCKLPEMTGNANCAGDSTSRPITVWLNGAPGTTWIINSNLMGHGNLVVDGNMSIEGNMSYWGTIAINGNFTASGAGNARVYGGIVSQSQMNFTGNLNVFGGVAITSAPVGRLIVTSKAWWER